MLLYGCILGTFQPKPQALPANCPHLCALPSNMQVARALLVAGADPDLPDKSSGQTPLHYAASGGYTGIIEDLLSKCG